MRLVLFLLLASQSLQCFAETAEVAPVQWFVTSRPFVLEGEVEHAQDSILLEEVIASSGLKAELDHSGSSLLLQCTYYQRIAGKDYYVLETSWFNRSPANVVSPVFLFEKETGLFAMVNIEKVHWISQSDSADGFYLAGTIMFRAKGWFEVFDLESNCRIFSSIKQDVRTTNHSLDPVTYLNGELALDNRDANGDGLADLHFTGFEIERCEDVQHEAGCDGKVYGRSPVSYLFIQRRREDGSPTWLLKE